MTSPTPMPTTLATGGFIAEKFFRGEGKSSYSHHFDEPFAFIVWVSIISFMILFVFTVYCLVKYRRRPGVAPESSPAHNTIMEITWTVVPSLTLVFMFLFGFAGYREMLVPKGGGLELNLTAQKWQWTIDYPSGATTRESIDANQFVATKRPIFYVPADMPVTLRMKSSDVIHSFYVPDFRLKLDVMPNRYTKYWFETKLDADAKKISAPDEKDPLHYLNGTPFEDHWVFCAEYCGDSHSEMAAILRVVPREAFDRWQETNGVGSLPPAEYGKILHGQLCATCHSTEGKQLTGPMWNDLYMSNQTMSDGSVIVADEDYIRESILQPAKKIVQGYSNVMPSFQGQLNDKQINAIIAFMKTISKYTPTAGAAPAGNDKKPEGNADQNAPKTEQPAAKK